MNQSAKHEVPSPRQVIKAALAHSLVELRREFRISFCNMFVSMGFGLFALADGYVAGEIGTREIVTGVMGLYLIFQGYCMSLHSSSLARKISMTTSALGNSQQ